MKIQSKGFEFIPKIRLELDRAAVEYLIDLSSRHYDAHCKSISRVGGFLYGWNNLFELFESDTVDVEATFREIDTLCKICELETSDMGDGLYNQLHGFLKSINERYAAVNDQVSLTQP